MNARDAILYRTADGLVICSSHADEVFGRADDAADTVRSPRSNTVHEAVVPRTEQLTYADGCTLCRTLPVENQTCVSCNTPLHPNWPAVYCSNECAFADAGFQQ